MPEVSEPIAINTGPLIALSACDNLDLLPRLHGPVVVAESVMAEFLRGGKLRVWGRAGAIPRPEWLDVRSLRAPPSSLMVEHLDAGEAATIALAVEQAIRLVAIDERRGRMVARAFGLRVTGSVGLLLRARREGLIPALRPCIEEMPGSGIWLGDPLVANALREAGEA
jgi:predicted nucleic acid-binding protein